MRYPRHFWIVALSLLTILAACSLCYGQTESATISGRVTDSSGAVLPGASVVLQSADRGTQIQTTTNNSGIYVFPSVQPGIYHITVRKEGFKTADYVGLTVNVQDHLEQNFRLSVGAISESVTVTAEQTNINTTDASVSTVVDQTYVKNMPLNGRSFQDLILLTPGVVTQTPQFSGGFFNGPGTQGEFSVNGQRTESNYYTVDGVGGNVGAAIGDGSSYINTVGPGASGSVPAATALGTTQALVSVDDLQEFRVQSSTYSAEYGRNPGGQFAFETKSGTNRWHGSAYDYLRNGYLDAQDWFNDYFGTPNGALHQNDFGGTLGGPVRIPGLYNGKDKTFFFVSYEGLRLNAPQPSTSNLIVPDAAVRADAAPFTALQAALNAFPLPTPGGLDFGDGTAQYIATWSNPSSINSTSVRFDHVVKDKLRLFFRFSDTSSSSARRGNGSLSPSEDIISDYTFRTYTAGATSLLTNRLSNDFRLNYSANTPIGKTTISPIGGSASVNLLQLSGLGAKSEASFVYLNSSQTQEASIDQSQWSAGTRQWNLVDTVSLSLGRHQLKFGADYRRTTSNAVVSTPSIGYRFFSPSDVQNNTPQTLLNLYAPGYPLYRNFSAFIEDEWRLAPRLTISMGLRWEVNPAPGVTQGLMPYTLQGSTLDNMALAPQGTPLWKTTWYNFAPRLGVAYAIRNHQGWETVLRGGGGVFFDSGQQLGSLAFSGPGFNSLNSTSTAFPANAPALITANSWAITNPPQAPYTFAYGYSPHLQLPYTLQWNASLEQAMGKSQALTVSYVGAHGSRLLEENSFLDFANPNTAFLVLIHNGLTSDYDSLQTKFERKLSRGLTALGSYTWSHLIDWGSQNSGFRYVRGNSDLDVRHNFSGALSYDLPSVGGGRVMNALLSHWGVDDRFTARTAFPVELNGSGNFAANGQLYNNGVNLVPGQPIFLYGANCASVLQSLSTPELRPGQACPGGRAINPNAFVNAPCNFLTTCYGTFPRNAIRLFGAWQLDMAVRREFPITESVKVQFRAEAFNIFNHPNFGYVDGTVGDGTFGQATTTLASALGVLSPLYQMGGNRSMQFALKIVF